MLSPSEIVQQRLDDQEKLKRDWVLCDLFLRLSLNDGWEVIKTGAAYLLRIHDNFCEISKDEYDAIKSVWNDSKEFVTTDEEYVTYELQDLSGNVIQRFKIPTSVNEMGYQMKRVDDAPDATPDRSDI